MIPIGAARTPPVASLMARIVGRVPRSVDTTFLSQYSLTIATRRGLRICMRPFRKISPNKARTSWVVLWQIPANYLSIVESGLESESYTESRFRGNEHPHILTPVSSLSHSAGLPIFFAGCHKLDFHFPSLSSVSRLTSTNMEFDTGYWCTPAHVIAAAVGLTILDITFVTLRFAARKKQRQTLKVDDWIVIPVTVCSHHLKR